MFTPILQPTAYRYQVYISHTSYICLYPSNYNIRYLYLISNTKYTRMRTFIPMHTHIYIHARIYPRPWATLRYAHKYRIPVFQGVWITGLYAWGFSGFGLGASLAASCHRHLILSYSHTPGHQHQWRIIDNNTPWITMLRKSPEQSRASTTDCQQWTMEQTPCSLLR